MEPTWGWMKKVNACCGVFGSLRKVVKVLVPTGFSQQVK